MSRLGVAIAIAVFIFGFFMIISSVLRAGDKAEQFMRDHLDSDVCIGDEK